jgi:hypothetical protein
MGGRRATPTSLWEGMGWPASYSFNFFFFLLKKEYYFFKFFFLIFGIIRCGCVFFLKLMFIMICLGVTC